MKDVVRITKPIILSLSSVLLLCSALNSFAVTDSQSKSQNQSQGQKQLNHRNDEVLVKLRVHSHGKTDQEIANALGASNIARFALMNKGDNSELMRWRKVKVPANTDAQSYLARISKHADVEVAELNYERTYQLTPNDAQFSSLWGMNNATNPSADIDATLAWNKLTDSSSVIVAVIDSGVDYRHPDLVNNMWKNPGEIAGNGIDDDGNGIVDDIYGANFIYTATAKGDPMDDNGHGTHCAGTIAASGNNGIGVAGVSWKAKVMALKFLNANGSGWDSDAVSAITYAVNKNAKILSNSWGGGNYSQNLYDAINAAKSAGVVFVAAAGNSAANVESGGYYPQGYNLPNIISVAATDSSDNLATFSNYGSTTVWLGAPGVDVLSTVPFSNCKLCDPSGYKALNGTSMATPHVSGAIALMLAQSPTLTYTDVKNKLKSSVDVTPSLTGKVNSNGRLNVNKALTVTDFSTSFTNGSLTASQNSSASFTFNVKTAATSRNLTLSFAGLDTTNLTGSFSASSLSIPANTTKSSTVTIATKAGAVPGNYPIRIAIKDTSNNTTSYAEASLKVTGPSFNITASPASGGYLGRSKSKTFALSLASLSNFAGTVTLNAVSSDSAAVTAALSSSSVSVPSGGSASANLTVTTSATAPIKNYYVTVTATNGNIKKVTDVVFEVTDYDIQPTNMTTENPIWYAGVWNGGVTVTLKNNGGTNYYDRVGFGYFVHLSNDNQITSSDNLINSNNVIQVAANSSASFVTSNHYVPHTYPSGTYYLGVIVDTYNLIHEFNENNNIYYIPIQVVNDVDLTPLSISPASNVWVRNNSYAMSGSIKNLGHTTALTDSSTSNHTCVYLSTDSTITTADYFVGKFYDSRIDGGVTATHTNENMWVNPNIPAGSYYLGMMADCNSVQKEANENNNILVYGTKITVQ